MDLAFTRIKETCLYVSDLHRSKAFYADKLGLEVISLVEGRHIFFRAGESVLLCFIPEVTAQDTSLPPHYGSGKLHLAFECSEANYKAWKAKVAEAEIPITHSQKWGGERYESFYFEDPDGHVLEIVPEGMWG